MARCVRCGWATNDLLSLIPTRPIGLGEAIFGRGGMGALRVAAFATACASVLVILFVGR